MGGILLGLVSRFWCCLRGPCTCQCSVGLGQRAVAHIRISIHLTLVQWSGNIFQKVKGALLALTTYPTVRELVKLAVWPEVLVPPVLMQQRPKPSAKQNQQV